MSGEVCDAVDGFSCKVPVVRTLYECRTYPLDRTLYQHRVNDLTRLLLRMSQPRKREESAADNKERVDRRPEIGNRRCQDRITHCLRHFVHIVDECT